MRAGIGTCYRCGKSNVAIIQDTCARCTEAEFWCWLAANSPADPVEDFSRDRRRKGRDGSVVKPPSVKGK